MHLMCVINDIKEHLVEIETINNLLREENQHLRGENIQNKKQFKSRKEQQRKQCQKFRNKVQNDASRIIRSKQNQLKILRKSTD